MKRLIKLKNIFYCALLFVFGLSFAALPQPPKAANAINSTDTVLLSTNFIYNPTHSIVHQNKLCFVDTHEGATYLKIFDVSNNNMTALLANKLDFAVVDAFFANDTFFILSTNKVYSLNLSGDTYEVSPLSNKTFEENSFSSIFVHFHDGEYIITLTPSQLSQTNEVLIYKKNNSGCEVFVVTDDYNQTHYENKSIITTIKVGENEYRYLYFYKNTVYARGLSSFSNKHFSSDPANLTSILDSSPNTQIAQISQLKFSDDASNDYFLITYQETIDEKTSTKSRIYLYNLDDFENRSFSLATPESTGINNQINSLTPYVQTNGSQIVYPSEGQDSSPEIICSQISTSTLAGNTFKNPTPQIDEHNSVSYEIKQTNQNTYLLKSPWDTSSDTLIEFDQQTGTGKDVLIVGIPKIGEKEIENLSYCLYTTTTRNPDGTYTFVDTYGYIKTSHLSDKTDVSVDELDLAQYVKVRSNTSLYKLPTKASDQLLTTDGRFSVKILSTFKGYKTGSVQWLKVEISGSTGFIDISMVDYSKDKINYLTTNATVSKDNTFVYSEANGQSKVILDKPLKNGTRVLIDGVRDTKTGFTKIKFNDEYGNEYEGYIKTDNLKSDNWSWLQIIGTILIAINLGILILILIYKNKKLSKAQSYNRSENEDEVLK